MNAISDELREALATIAQVIEKQQARIEKLERAEAQRRAQEDAARQRAEVPLSAPFDQARGLRKAFDEGPGGLW